MQSLPLNQNSLLIVRKRGSTHTPGRTDAANASFAVHKILLGLTEAPTFVEAVQVNGAMSRLRHAFLYAPLLTARMFPKITAFATEKASNF